MSEEIKPIAPDNEGFDPGEVDAPTVALATGLIIIIIIAAFVGVTLFWDKFLNGRFKEVVEGSPNAQLEQLHKREDGVLTNYSYVDKAKGQVRIPLDRAMQLLISEVQAGKAPYNTKDTPKVVDPAAAAAAPGAAAPAAGGSATVAAPAAPAEHH